jgi:hypothetical protein
MPKVEAFAAKAFGVRRLAFGVRRSAFGVGFSTGLHGSPLHFSKLVVTVLPLGYGH